MEVLKRLSNIHRFLSKITYQTFSYRAAFLQMGFGKKFKNKKNSVPVDPQSTDTFVSYKEINKSNEKFTKYYKGNCIPSTDDQELEIFLGTLQKPLPSTFRITGSRKHALQLRDFMKKKYFSLFSSTEHSDPASEKPSIAPPKAISWYPDELGWVMDGSKSALKSDKFYADFHKFLVNETEIGNITRQEAVSMIPPLLLDVHSGHLVLDMCAAPGSKTTQIIEALHQQDANGLALDSLVIANDADNKRCYTLTHQTKRLLSPSLLVTNHDASVFPKIMRTTATNVNEQIFFDRILCDVPCSGDGTLRKNMLIWKNWTSMHGNGLHSLQVKILDRGCHLLREGGRIVYSTCSLNPVENEAVVSEVLARYPDSLRLLDVSDSLQGLKRRPGIESWKVMGKDGEFYTDYSEIPFQFADKFKPSMFPSTAISLQSIQRCLRIYPHLQDTGGFFVAVLEKIGPIGSAEKNKISTANSNNENTPSDYQETSCDVVERQYNGYKEKPFILMGSDDDKTEIASISDHFGLDPTTFPSNQYLVRSNEGKNRTIYFCSLPIQQILTSTNCFGLNESLKIINTGTKAFSRNNGNHANCACPYRLHYEHVLNVRHVMKKRVIAISLDDLVACLTNEFVAVEALSENCRKTIEMESKGCFVFSIMEMMPNGYMADVAFPVWAGKSSVTVYLVPEEKKSILERISE